jgi:hypothetical protein
VAKAQPWPADSPEAWVAAKPLPTSGLRPLFVTFLFVQADSAALPPADVLMMAAKRRLVSRSTSCFSSP